jgi:hypothetical protein
VSDSSEITGDNVSYDSHGDQVETFTYADGGTDSFVHGADGSEYEVQGDAYGNEHVDGVTGDGTTVSGDVNSSGTVTDAYAEDSGGNQVAMQENSDGTYQVAAEDSSGNYASDPSVDPYAN